MASVLPFNGFYDGNSPKNSSRTCVNYMPIRHDAGSYSEYTLETTSGITGPLTETAALTIAGGDVISPIYDASNNSYLFFVAYNGVFCVTGGNFAYYYETGINTFSSRYRFTSNKDNIIAVPETGGNSNKIIIQNGSIFDPLSVSVFDIQAEFGPTYSLRFVDACYFGNRFLLLSDIDNIGVYYSGIEDPESYSPLDFFNSLEQSSQKKGMCVLNNRLYLFSDRDYSVWTVTPDVNLPFSQQKSSSGNIGLLSADSKCEGYAGVYFIGISNKKTSFFLLSGAGISRVSNDYIDYELSQDGSTDNAICFSFSDQGRSFIAFSLSAATYCLDLDSGEFHKRSTNSGRWNVIGCGYNALSQEQVFVGSEIDYSVVGEITADIGVMSDSIATEYGGEVNREVVTSAFNSKGVTNNVRELALSTELINPVIPIASSNDDVSLEISSDFGGTYSTPRIGSMDTDVMTRFRNMGIFRDSFLIRIKTQSKKPHKILKMLTRLEKGFRQI